MKTKIARNPTTATIINTIIKNNNDNINKIDKIIKQNNAIISNILNDKNLTDSQINSLLSMATNNADIISDNIHFKSIKKIAIVDNDCN